MDANNTQPWYASRTIWTGIALLVCGGAAALGLPLDPGMLTEEGMALGMVIGGGLAIWGRIKATKRISK